MFEIILVLKHSRLCLGTFLNVLKNCLHKKIVLRNFWHDFFFNNVLLNTLQCSEWLTNISQLFWKHFKKFRTLHDVLKGTRNGGRKWVRRNKNTLLLPTSIVGIGVNYYQVVSNKRFKDSLSIDFLSLHRPCGWSNRQIYFLFAREPVLLPAFACWYCKTFNNNHLLLQGPTLLTGLWRYIADALIIKNNLGLFENTLECSETFRLVWEDCAEKDIYKKTSQ